MLMASVKRTYDTGSRPVNRYGNIYWKVRPTAPYCELSFHLCGKIFCGLSSAPSEIVKLQTKKKGKDKFYFVQASRSVEGIGMHKVLREFPDWIVKFDPVMYGKTTVQHFLGLPQDAKDENFIAIPEKNPDGDVVNVTWKGIDEDECFAHPLCIYKDKTHYVNVRSIFFCLPQIYSTIHPEVRKHFASMNPAGQTLEWLQELWEANKLIKEFWRQGLITEKHMKKMQLPLKLLEDLIPRFYEKLVTIKNLMTASNNLSYMEPMKIVVPELAYYYDIINKRFPNNPLEAFYFIAKGYNNHYEEVMKSLRTLPVINNMPLSEYLLGSKFKDTDYMDLRNTLPEIAAENFLKVFDFKTHTLDEQLEILNVLHRFPLTELTIRNCTVLTDGGMRTLMSLQPNLKQLTLLGCPQITSSSLDVIAERNRSIELMISECSGIQPAALSALEGYLQKITTRDRRATIVAKPSSFLEDSASSVSDPELREFVIALDRGEWQQVVSRFSRLTKNLVPLAKIRIVDKLLTTDLMRQIIKNNIKELLMLFNILGIEFDQKNANGDTFFHICCEESNLEMLKILCEMPPNWNEIVDLKKRTPCHVAVEKRVLIASKF